MAEIIIFWVSFWVFVIPFFYVRCFKKETVHEYLYKQEEDNEEDEE
jgi:hypothetical protein